MTVVSCTVAVANLVESAALNAVIVTVWVAFTVTGAVYRPLEIVPTGGLRVHVTAVLGLPTTAAVNCRDWDAPSEADDGLRLILMGVSSTVAVSVLDGSWILVAVTVIV